MQNFTFTPDEMHVVSFSPISQPVNIIPYPIVSTVSAIPPNWLSPADLMNIASIQSFRWFIKMLNSGSLVFLFNLVAAQFNFIFIYWPHTAMITNFLGCHISPGCNVLRVHAKNQLQCQSISPFWEKQMHVLDIKDSFCNCFKRSLVFLLKLLEAKKLNTNWYGLP